MEKQQSNNSSSNSSSLAIQLRSEYESAQLGRSRFTVMSSIVAPTLDKSKVRAPIDLVAVVDRSGSMAGKKLELVKQACDFIVDELLPGDSLSIIDFDTSTRIVVPIGPILDSKDKIHKAIDKIQSGGGTDLHLGLMDGIKEAQKSTSGNKVNSVLAFTDGLAESGITDTASIVRDEKKQLAVTENSKVITVNTFGFGKDHSPDMLKAISEAGGGQYYFIETADDIGNAFADCLGGLVSVAGQKLSLTVEPLNGCTIEKVLGVQKQSKARTGKKQNKVRGRFVVDSDSGSDSDSDEIDSKFPEEDDTTKSTSAKSEKVSPTKKKIEQKPLPDGSKEPQVVQLGDIFSEEHRDIITQIILPAGGKEGEELPAVKFTLTWMDNQGQQQKKETTFYVGRSGKEFKLEDRDFEVDKQINRVIAADVMKESEVIADAGDLDKAKQMIQDVIDQIESSMSAKDELCLLLVDDLKDIMKDMNNRRNYEQMAKKKMNWKNDCHSRQRAVGRGGSIYANSAKKEMAEKEDKKSAEIKSAKYASKSKPSSSSSGYSYNDDEDDASYSYSSKSKSKKDKKSTK